MPASLLSPPPSARSVRLGRARELLHQHFGYPDFRPAQRRVVESVLSRRDTLAILPTGGGKSVCFQVPALVLEGFTLVVSPLISLMQDQVEACLARGIQAAALNSALSPARQRAVLEALDGGDLRLLYVSPERLARLAPQLAARGCRPVFLAVDEAHCIAEWGHDFRPSYRSLRRARRALGWPPVVALTGSATPAVRDDIARSLGLGSPGAYDLHLGSFDRRNLWFGVVPVRDDRERWAALRQLLATDDRVAIVYAPTRNQVEALARLLGRAGYLAAPYHAGLRRERREQVLMDFLGDRLEVIVATCAFGMGIDKPNVRLVVHWTMPPTPEAYYQEAGRAGRDGAPARCILLHHPADGRLPRRQLDVTFPPEPLVEKIWSGPAGRRGVPGHVVESAERLARELHPERGPVDWRPVRRRRGEAEGRIAAVEGYAGGATCRRATLLGYFGERLARCAGCDRCGTRREGLPLPPAARARLSRLRTALGPHRAPWGRPLLDAVTQRVLALQPPGSPGELAEVPGVGPILAARLGRVILEALWQGADLRPLEAVTGGVAGRVFERLRDWRRGVAAAVGVPEWRVATDRLLLTLATEAPAGREALARVSGVGPRFLNKHGEAVLALLSDEPAPATPR